MAQNSWREKLNRGWGALLTTIGPALAHPGTAPTEGRHQGLWDHRGMHLTQGEGQGRLPGGGGLELKAHRH